MAKSFSIKDIKIKESKKDYPKLLTGDVTEGLSPDSPITPNAEVEGKEVLKYPDGTVQNIEGPSHEKGGVKMNLPDNTEIVSKSLKLTKEDAKILSSKFDIEVSTKDSYAAAIDKYQKKIGLAKLNAEQEDVINSLKKALEKKGVSEDTKRINNEYLSNKIYDIEAKKAPLEDQRKSFFDAVFERQEINKPQPTTGQTFQDGGVSSEAFNRLAEQFGLTPDQAQNILAGKQMQTFDLGGTYDAALKTIQAKTQDAATIKKDLNDLYNSGKLTAVQFSSLSAEANKVGGAVAPVEGKLRGTYETNEFSGATPVAQTAGAQVYGTEKDPLKIIATLAKNFPDIVTDPEVFGNIIDLDAYKKNKEIKWKGEAPNFATQNKNVLKFQEKVNDRMKASASHIISNKDNFDLPTVKKAEEYLAKETFTGAKKKDMTVEEKVRSNDEMLGDFTAGRYALKMDVLTPEESKLLADKGVYTLKQLSDEDLKTLSPGSQEKVAQLKKGITPNADFSLSTYTPATPAAVKPETKETPVTDKVDTRVKPKYPQMFYTPDQSVLPPPGQSPETLIQNRFQRVSPIIIGPEQQQQALANLRQESYGQLEGLTPSQRAAAAAGIFAKSGELENQAIYSTNVANAQNIANAEQFNIGQSDRENISQGVNLLNYEGRALTAQAKTEQDLRNYLNRGHEVAMQNFQNNQRLNLLNSMFPDYQLDFYGMNTVYDPSTEFQLRNNDTVNRNLPGAKTPTTTTDSSTILNQS